MNPTLDSPIFAEGPSGWNLLTMIPAIIGAIAAIIVAIQGRKRDDAQQAQAKHDSELTEVRAAFEMQKSLAEQASTRADRAERRADELEAEIKVLKEKLTEQEALNKAYRAEFDQYRFEALTRQDEMRKQLEQALGTITLLQAQVAALQKSA